MKKTRKWPSFIMAAITVLSFSACEEWGQMDPPAGTDIYPKLEQVANIDFEPSEKEGETGFIPESFNYYAYEGGDIAMVEKDDDHGNVLHLPNGYARTFNPLTAYKAQNGVSLTFWVKQALRIDDETKEELEPDLTGALFSFQNSNGAQRMFITANGWLKYEAVDGEYEANNPETNKVSKNPLLLPAGEWHYMAVTVRNDGYSIYVDGKQCIDKIVPEAEFDFSKIVQFMASTPYLYIGNGSDTPTQEMWIDEIKIYRNQITDSECQMPGTGSDEVSPWLIVGSEDYSTPWWTAFSDLFTHTGDGSINLGFYNHTTGTGANHENWVLVITNGKAIGEDGYAEYVVLRNDAWGWGTYYDSGTMTHEFKFDDGSFVPDMQNSWVDLTLTRMDGHMAMVADITCTSGKTYHYTFDFDGNISDTWGCFLTCENSWLEISKDEIFNGQTFTDYVVGATDSSAAWWTTFSDLDVLNGDFTNFAYEFINGNTGTGGNHNNWVLVCTNGKAFGEAGYAEYFVLRSDAYGWGDKYDGNNIVHDFNWDTFVKDMHNSTTRIYLTNSGGNLSLLARVKKENGEMLPDYRFSAEGISGEIGFFFVLDGNYLDIRKVGFFPYAITEPQQ